MPWVARIGDSVEGFCNNDNTHGNVSGVISSGSPDTFNDNIPIARIGDTVSFSCGHTGVISSGSSIVFINDIPVARIGDSVSGDVSGTIISGSSNFNVER